MAAPETIADLWFINWETNNPQVARRLSSIAYCLTFNGSGRRITNENMLDLGGIRNVTLYDCSGITDVSALGGVHNLSLSNCSGITDVSALGGVHTLILRGCRGITDVSALEGHYDFTNDHTLCPSLA